MNLDIRIWFLILRFHCNIRKLWYCVCVKIRNQRQYQRILILILISPLRNDHRFSALISSDFVANDQKWPRNRFYRLGSRCRSHWFLNFLIWWSRSRDLNPTSTRSLLRSDFVLIFFLISDFAFWFQAKKSEWDQISDPNTKSEIRFWF